MKRPSRVSSIHCSITGCRAATASSTGSSVSTGRTYRRSAARCAKFASRSASATAADVRRILPAASSTFVRKLSKDPLLNLDAAIVRGQNLDLVLLQLRRRKPLRIHQRLLALVIRRSHREIRLRDLDVVAEHRVVAHLQRTNSRPRRSRSSIAAIDCRPVVEIARSSSSSASTPAAIAPPSAIVSGGSATSVVAIRAVTSSSVSSRRNQFAPQRSGHRLQRSLQSRQPRQACRQRAHIARSGGIQTQPRQQPLQIENPVKRSPYLLALHQIARAPRPPPHSAHSITSASISGRRIVARSIRLPIGVWHASSV